MPQPPASMLDQPADGPLGERIFTAGTLRYTKGALWLLFSWLMWNDLCLMLMEQVAPNLVPLLLKDHGASNRDIAFFMSTLTGTFTLWINPVVSTWSDRHRGSAGRRRPFLFFATPFCAIGLGAVPFMPDLFHYLQRFPAFGAFISHHASFGVVAFIGIGFLFYQIFNSVILAIFTYYFWDVVPESVLGRFSAMTKIVGTLTVFIWNFFLFGQSERHMKALFVGVAAFFFIAYMVSLWRVKEGEYPPPPAQSKPGFWTVISSYFRDCYKPYYLWFIVANTVYQVGNLSNSFQIFLFRDQLHLSVDTIGKMKAVPSLLVVLIAYPMGSVVDRLKPARVLIAAVILYGMVNIGGFVFLNGKWTLFAFVGCVATVVCVLQISQSVFIVDFFPREKLGQFASANTLLASITAMIVAPFVGHFLDWIKDYRYALLWSTSFYFLSIPLYLKCYFNWRRLKAFESLAEPAINGPGKVVLVEA
jgi:MFS family permease